jgi:hypothetical protein
VARFEERVRIEVGFEGGQAMSILVEPSEAEAFETALSHGDGEAFALDAEDGHYTIALKRVTYVKRFARESRVGFGLE